MKRLWLDLGDLGAFVTPAGPFERWQDHGLGLMRTILERNGVPTDLRSIRGVRDWDELRPQLAGYDLLLMNVRSYTYPFARRAARLFKEVNPTGIVATGGMHATVAPQEMEAIEDFDRIIRGAGEQIIVDVATDPLALPRVSDGASARSIDDWPIIDRKLWPNPGLDDYPWPLEPECGWGPGPVATVLTSRVCPWQCSFCNEASYIANMGRRSPEAVVDELNYLDERYGPLGSVVIHDSMFFQQPAWLTRWLEVYSTRARRRWPYWAAARADTVRRWPELFEALVRETNWSTVSIGFESGSDRALRILNKECSAADNYFAIDLLNRIGDEYKAAGRKPPVFWTNIILAIPGETREDAFDTMRMVREMRYRQVSPAFYAPYPGSALGYQLIAEGNSLLNQDNYHRYPHDEKMKGTNYEFYRELLAGKYDAEVAARPLPASASDRADRPTASHGNRFYLFDLDNGKSKLGYGSSPQDALDTLQARLGADSMRSIRRDSYRVIKQRDLQSHVANLG